jgi:glutathione peroxidase
MTLRQNILRILYPMMMKITHRYGPCNKILINKENVKPKSSFYTLWSVDNKGSQIMFDQFRNKKVLIVNTASDCGYTAQYSELQNLHEKTKEEMIMIGFPANDFKNQENRSDEEIAGFCKNNYGITFPIMKKSTVIKNESQNEVFKWLTDPKENGWNDHQPDWNFCKYLIDENGVLTNFFGSAISPLGNEISMALK